MEKNSGNIILLHLNIINEDHMMCGSWDIKPRQTEFLVILGLFCPLTLPAGDNTDQNKSWYPILGA